MSGASYISNNDFRLHFGLGQASKVDLIAIRWPSGAEESFSNIEVNQLLYIQEAKGIIKAEKFSPRKQA